MPIAKLTAPQRWRPALVAVLAALALAACQHEPPPPSNVTPEKAVATNLRMTAAGDLDGLMRNRLPPADYTQWRKEWAEQHAHPVPMSVAQQEQFARIMKMLTEPGAEKKLLARLEPELAAAGKGRRMPVLASILEAAGRQMIDASPQLGPAQKKMALEGLDALVAWTGTVDFSDRAKATKAVDLVCATARALHVETLAQWRALDYGATMRHYGTLWNGLESLLGIYGLDVGKSLTDARVTTLADTDGVAMVKLEMTFAGKPISGQWAMQKLDGHWYDVALLEAWHEAHPAPAASTVAPATGGSLAAPTAHAGSVAPATSTPAPARS